jgi:hypothetical protein
MSSSGVVADAWAARAASIGDDRLGRIRALPENHRRGCRSKAVPPEKLDPGDDHRGTPDHRVERLEGLLLAEPSDPFDEELQVGLNGTEIDVLGITSWHEGAVIVWHRDVMPE